MKQKKKAIISLLSAKDLSINLGEKIVTALEILEKKNASDDFKSDILEIIFLLISNRVPADVHTAIAQPLLWRMARKALLQKSETLSEEEKSLQEQIKLEMTQSPDLLKRELIPALFATTLECIRQSITQLPKNTQQENNQAHEQNPSRSLDSLSKSGKKRLVDRQSTGFIQEIEAIKADLATLNAQDIDPRVAAIKSLLSITEAQLIKLGEYKQLEISAVNIVLNQVVTELASMGLLKDGPTKMDASEAIRAFITVKEATEKNLVEQPEHRKNRATALITSNSVIMDAALSFSKKEGVSKNDLLEIFELCYLPPHIHYKKNEFLLSDKQKLPSWLAGTEARERKTAILFVQSWLENFWSMVHDSPFLAEMGIDATDAALTDTFATLAESIVFEKTEQLRSSIVINFDKLGQVKAQNNELVSLADLHTYLSEELGVDQNSWLAEEIVGVYVQHCEKITEALLTISSDSASKRLESIRDLEKKKIAQQQQELESLLGLAEKLSKPQNAQLLKQIFENRVDSTASVITVEQQDWLTEWVGISSDDLPLLIEMIDEAINYRVALDENLKSDLEALVKSAAELLLPESLLEKGYKQTLSRRRQRSPEEIEKIERKILILEKISGPTFDLTDNQEKEASAADSVSQAFLTAKSALQWSMWEIKQVLDGTRTEDDVQEPLLLTLGGQDRVRLLLDSILNLRKVDRSKKKTEFIKIKEAITELQEYCIKVNVEKIPEELKLKLFTIVLKDLPTILEIFEKIANAELAQTPLIPASFQQISGENPINQGLVIVETLAERLGGWGNKIQTISLDLISKQIFTLLHGKRIAKAISQAQQESSTSDPVEKRWQTFSGIFREVSSVFEDWWNFEIARKARDETMGKEQEKIQTATSALAHFATRIKCEGRAISSKYRSAMGMHIAYDLLRFFSNTHPEDTAKVEMPVKQTSTGEYSLLFLMTENNTRTGEANLVAKKVRVPVEKLSGSTPEEVNEYLASILKQNNTDAWRKVSGSDIRLLEQKNKDLLASMPTAAHGETAVTTYPESEYLDTDNLWCAHGIIRFSDSSDSKKTSLEESLNLLINPYTVGGAFSAEIGVPPFTREYDRGPDQKVEVVVTHNHSNIDGATSQKWLPEVIAQAVKKAPDSNSGAGVFDSIDLRTDWQGQGEALPAVNEKALNHSTIQEYTLSENFLKVAASDIFPFFYNTLGIQDAKFTAHYLEGLILQHVLGQMSHHFLEKSSSGALTPVIQICSADSLKALEQSKDVLVANPQKALQDFKDLFLKENVVNMTQRTGAKNETGLNTTPMMADIGGSNGRIRDLLVRLAGAPVLGISPLTDLLTFSQGMFAKKNILVDGWRRLYKGSNKTAPEAANDTLFLVSNISPNTVPKESSEANMDEITAKQVEFTTADSRNYACTVGIYVNEEGRIVFSVRTNPRTPQKIQDKLENMEELFSTAEQQVLEYFLNIKETILKNPNLANSLLFVQE